MKTVFQPRIRVSLGRRRVRAFHVCGLCGFVLAVVLGAALAGRHHLSLGVFAGVLAAAVAAFLTLAMTVKIVTGRETLIYYHHEIAVFAAVSALLAALRLPVLPFLDIAAVCLGLFLACGRIGCLFAGCCHGRPHRWGVCYGSGHAAEGLPRELAGVPLLPVQAIESACVLGIVVCAIALVLSRPVGTAFTWYLGAYGAVRFALEFLRGDTARRYWLGLSEAQWISLAAVSGSVCSWLRTPVILVPVAILVVAGLQWARARFSTRVCGPAHVRELAQAAERAERAAGTGPSPIAIAETSLGVRISTGAVPGPLRHLAFSRPEGRLGVRTARRLARLLARRRQWSVVAVLDREGRVFHLLGRPAAAPQGLARPSYPLARPTIGGSADAAG